MQRFRVRSTALARAGLVAAMLAVGACREATIVEPRTTAEVDNGGSLGLEAPKVAVFEVSGGRNPAPRRYEVPLDAVTATTPGDFDKSLARLSEKARSGGRPSASAATLLDLAARLSNAKGAAAKDAVLKQWAKGKGIRSEKVGKERRLTYVASDGRTLRASWPESGASALVGELDCETDVGALEPSPDCGYDPNFDPAPMEIMAAEIVMEADGMDAAAYAEMEAFTTEFSMSIPEDCRIKLYEALRNTGVAIGSAGLMVWWARQGQVYKAWGAAGAALDGIFMAYDAFDEYYQCVQEAKIRARGR